MTRGGNLHHGPKNGDGDRKATEALGGPILQFLAADEDRFVRFLDVTGLTVAGLRAASASAGFAESLLDYIGADERLMITFAEDTGGNLAEIAALHERLAARSRGC